MFFVYLIKSKKDGLLYVGCTSNLTERIKKHNEGMVVSTKNRIPFELVYFEGYKSKEDAFRREHNLKLKANALTGLKRRLVQSVGKAL
jgi:putative endonuclease